MSDSEKKNQDLETPGKDELIAEAGAVEEGAGLDGTESTGESLDGDDLFFDLPDEDHVETEEVLLSKQRFMHPKD